MQGIATKLIIPLAVSLTLLTGCGKKEEQQAAGGDAVSVGVVEVGARKIDVTTELPGRTSPYVVAEIRPQVGGIIQKRLFEEGSIVKKNSVLYQIDPAVFQATYDSAVATFAKAEANLAASKSRAERYAELVKINAVSKQESDDAEAAYKQGIADVAAARAAVESASINLNYTRVTSPITGHIGKSEVTQGALVTANQASMLARVQQLDPIYVDLTQSSVDWLRLKNAFEAGALKRTVGDKNKIKVKLELEDKTMYKHDGVLEFSDVTVEEATGMITIRAEFPNPNRDLLPGMYVRAIIEQGVNEDAILIPQKALSRTQRGEPQVILVKDDNSVEHRVIDVDKEYGKEWIVRSGLKVGEKIIVEGAQNLRGTDIKVDPQMMTMEEAEKTLALDDEQEKGKTQDSAASEKDSKDSAAQKKDSKNSNKQPPMEQHEPSKKQDSAKQ